MKQKTRRFYTITIVLVVMLTICITSSGFADRGIRLLINGQDVYTDVLPVQIDGRVMVPIRVVSNELGANVDWDTFSRTVTIDSTQNAFNYDSWLNDKIALAYLTLYVMGESLEDVRANFALCVMERDETRALETLEMINNCVEVYNSFQNNYGILADQANENNVDISDISVILDNYESAFDDYLSAYKYLTKYYHGENIDISNIATKSILAYNSSYKGKNLSKENCGDFLMKNIEQE